MVSANVRDLLQRQITPDVYQQVLREWKTHSMAEDQRDIPGLIATLTPDCVYEIPQASRRWEGHEGARQFYTQLLTAFPDIQFELANIVAGPQGVYEEAGVTGTFRQDWLDYPATGRPVTFRVIIFFPWDPDRRKFTGERIFVDGAPLIQKGTWT